MQNLLKNIALGVVSASVCLGMGAGAAFADSSSSDMNAQDTQSVGVQASFKQADGGTCDQTCMNVLKHYGDMAIAARITTLNDAATRVPNMAHVSATVKTSLQAQITTNLSALNALKVKIDADTDAATLSSDVRSIFTTYRIYALVRPQIYLLAGADTTQTLNGLFGTLSGTLQTAITNASSTVDKAAAQAKLDDMNAQVAAANTLAVAAQAEIQSLVPDQGNQTVKASNNAAITDARAKMQQAQTDLQKARQDITDIRAIIHA